MQLKKCEIIKRLNKFVVLIKIKNKLEKAYTNNTGRLIGLIEQGKIGYYIRGSGKLKYRLIAIGDSLIDVQFQMRLFEDNIKKIFPKCKILKRNVKFENSIFDYLLYCNGKKRYLEVKSAIMEKGEYAMYPDCISKRGRKHIGTIAKLGKKGIILFIAAFKNAKAFKPNVEVDEKILELLKKAKKAGVKISAIKIYFDTKKRELKFGGKIPVILA